VAKYDFYQIVDSIYAGMPIKRILEKHAYDPLLILGINQEIERRKTTGEVKLKKPKKEVKEVAIWEQEEDGCMKFIGVKRS
jgi:hypothetical protein